VFVEFPAVEQFEKGAHRLDDPLVAGHLVVLAQRLQQDGTGPRVVGKRRERRLARADPAVLGSPVEKALDPRAGLRSQRLVVEQRGEGHQPVGVVGTAFPAVLAAAEPLVVRERRPELVETAREPVGLHPELATQPPPWRDASQRERIERARGQVVVGCHGNTRRPAPS
jgi:hypothetical protein